MTISSNFEEGYILICNPLTKACKCIVNFIHNMSGSNHLIMHGFSFESINSSNYTIINGIDGVNGPKFWYYEFITSKWRLVENCKSTFSK